jgi:hypothetical protein
VFISSGYSHGCALLQLSGGKLRKIYENRSMRNHMATCVLYDGMLLGFDGNSHSRRTVNLVGMDHRTGEVRFKHGGLGCGTLLVSDCKVIALGDEGELQISEITPQGLREISRAQVLDGRCWTVPVLCQGRLYCRNAAGDVICLDLR